jgi:hypothetical protein
MEKRNQTMKILNMITLTMALCWVSFLSEANDNVVVNAEDIKWGLLNPLRGDASPRAADLWGDRTKDVATGLLVKFHQGFSSPPHIHNVSYRGVVIKGLIHNDDPNAERMWMPSGSYWTQPAGESHITAADGEENLIYIEIDEGPYLVHPADQEFDNGERPVNIEQRNLVWLDSDDLKWIKKDNVQVATLWQKPENSFGLFLRLPPKFKGRIVSDSGLKAVVISGKGTHQSHKGQSKTALTPSGFFSSKIKSHHELHAESELILYIHSQGRFIIK